MLLINTKMSSFLFPLSPAIFADRNPLHEACVIQMMMFYVAAILSRILLYCAMVSW
jgi:hypothetical protein